MMAIGMKFLFNRKALLRTGEIIIVAGVATEEARKLLRKGKK